MKEPFGRLRGALGFSITDMVATMAVIATLTAVAIPQTVNIVDQMRLGMASRDVERELQYARLKAVSANRPMRVRFDCPSAGMVRAVELIGSPAAPDSTDADAYTARCNEATYPYRPTGADQSRLSRPNNDGPVRYLQQGTTFTAKQTLEFWPNGTVHTACQSACDITSTQINTVTITLSRKSKTKNITVNGLGKILMDR